MQLDVIGAGFGRTGTASLKTALERLGFGPCYHMYEVYSHPDHATAWLRANAGEAVNWDDVFEGYRSTVDWPACTFWRELLTACPNAKLVLSVRPPDRWYDSFHETIYQALVRPTPADAPDWIATLLRFTSEVVKKRTFGDKFEELTRDEIIGVYEAHNAAVVAEAPKDQLLVFDVAEGWSPLCGILGVAAPSEPFPNINDREQFRELHGLQSSTLREPPDRDELARRVRAITDTP
jgi:hypothetical protein